MTVPDAISELEKLRNRKFRTPRGMRFALNGRDRVMLDYAIGYLREIGSGTQPVGEASPLHAQERSAEEHNLRQRLFAAEAENTTLKAERDELALIVAGTTKDLLTDVVEKFKARQLLQASQPDAAEHALAALRESQKQDGAELAAAPTIPEVAETETASGMSIHGAIQNGDATTTQELKQKPAGQEGSQAAATTTERKAPYGTQVLLRCSDCQRPYRFFDLDMTIPDDQWLAINHGSCGGVLCPSCIVARLARLPGAIAVRAYLELAAISPTTEVSSPTAATAQKDNPSKCALVPAPERPHDGDECLAIYRIKDGKVVIEPPHKALVADRAGAPKPERLEWLKSFAVHLRQRASDNGCYGQTAENCCVTDEPDLEKWCDYCRLGESAVQIELLIGSGNQAAYAEPAVPTSRSAAKESHSQPVTPVPPNAPEAQ